MSAERAILYAVQVPSSCQDLYACEFMPLKGEVHVSIEGETQGRRSHISF